MMDGFAWREDIIAEFDKLNMIGGESVKGLAVGFPGDGGEDGWVPVVSGTEVAAEIAFGSGIVDCGFISRVDGVTLDVELGGVKG
jgi:hypothetical protein